MTETGRSTEMAINAARIDFTSGVNGKSYRLLVSVPAGDPPAAGWPVIYLIDGSLHFGIAVDTARIQSRWPDTRDAVIVGIAYQTDSVAEALQVRNHDLTPVTTQAYTDKGWFAKMGAGPETFGGMDAYLEMIETEAKPRVAAHVPIDTTDQTLMGHSLGGLTTLAACLRTPERFRHYVAISPSIWMTDRWVLGHVDAFIERVKRGDVNARLLMSTGEHEESIPPFPPLPKIAPPMSEETYEAMITECRMVTDPRALFDRLQPLRGDRFDVDFVVHLGDDHRSVVPAGIARGYHYAMYRP